MKYFIIEGHPDGEYNATNKAREDVETILKKNNIEPFYVETEKGIQTNKLMKWKQFITYSNNKKVWDKSLDKLNKGDIVFIQYPILNTALNIINVIKKYSEKGIRFVAIIHDLDSLRFKGNCSNMQYNRICKEDKELLNLMDQIICHNASMKKVLIDLGNKEDKIVELMIFDYLIDFEPKKINRTKKDPIIIAGNLSPFKAKYISYLKDLNTSYNLYGVGYTDEIGGKNISYKGKFKPDELINHLEGSFGLVWDGESIDTCVGGFGGYLRYNNPHKVSLYLTAGIPVIVWKESAMAKFIEKNNLGITVNNLHEIEEKVNKLTDKEYNEICGNIKAVSKRLRNGEYLTDAINKIK